MKLALFDLDHTLIPFDSGMAWTRFLAERGALPPDAEDTYLSYCRQYVAGTLDIRAMHRATVSPLSRYPAWLLGQWSREFEAAMAPRIPQAMHTLVQGHRAAGDLCAIVTATTRFIAEPFGRLLGVPHVLATEAVMAGGVPTGEIDGEPCYREHKVAKVKAWLAQQGLVLPVFAQTWCYSDSISDLPLLLAVSNPVVVAPDERLLAHARLAGWPVMNR